MTDETTSSPANTTHTFPKWAPQAGFGILAVTLVFLMGLVVAAVLGKPIPDQARILIASILALTMAAGTAFLGGSAAAQGKLPIPGSSRHPVSYTIGGSAAVFVIVLVFVATLFRPAHKAAPEDVGQAREPIEEAAAAGADSTSDDRRASLTEDEPSAPASAETVEPDWSAPPTYGEMALSAGFTPDPRMELVRAGGATRLYFGNCGGWIHPVAPDLAVEYQAGGFALAFYAAADTDLILVVRAPDGQWFCGDDYDGTNPVVYFNAPLSGRYTVWVGTFHEQGNPLPEAALFVSESIPGA